MSSDKPYSYDMDRVIFDRDDIAKRLYKLNVNKSGGPDSLHPRILKECSQQIAEPVKMIFDCSLKSSSLPIDWRSGTVSPIYKKGSRRHINNYRPVSLTCVLCKIMESIVRDNLINYFLRENYLSNKQYGFIKGRSTVTQLLEVLDKWTECLEKGGQIDAIYMDLEKAFDKVSHSLLLQKLKSYNINDKILNWIKGFLINRRQRVRVSNFFSNWVEVISGIPQGSVLGPLLFVIYINDLMDVCNSGSDLYLFADDSKLFNYVIDDVCINSLQSDLNSLNDWIKKWLLKLNIIKCKVVTYSMNDIINSNYYLDNVELEKLSSIKDLGVTFDSKLKFNLHIIDKVNKAYSMLGIIRRNFKYLNQDAFIMLYKSMVRSHLEYANSVWSPFKVGDILTLEKVQKRATKLIFSIKHLSYAERLKKLNLPTLKYRRARGDMIEVFKILTGKYNNVNNISLTLNNDSCTRGNIYKLKQKQIKYNCRKYFFTNRVVGLWNSLPDHVVGVGSIDAFKNNLDKFWSNQHVLYYFESDFIGTGSRSCNY